VFRNKEQRKIFGYKKDELTAGCKKKKKLHKEKLLKYSSISDMTKQVDE
jgi:hypothetical protein